MCAELPSEYHALLGALRDYDEAEEFLEAAEERARRWSWRKAPSGIEHQELAWTERHNLPMRRETPGDPPTNIATDQIGRDEHGEFVFAQLHNHHGERAGRVGRDTTDGITTVMVLGGRRREISRAWLHADKPTRVQRAQRTGRDAFEFVDERYDRRSPELTVIAQIASHYTDGHFEQRSPRELQCRLRPRRTGRDH